MAAGQAISTIICRNRVYYTHGTRMYSCSCLIRTNMVLSVHLTKVTMVKVSVRWVPWPKKSAGATALCSLACCSPPPPPFSSHSHAAKNTPDDPVTIKVVMYSSSKTKKTVDKSAILNARKGRFAMDRPFPGVPPLKPPGALKVSCVAVL